MKLQALFEEPIKPSQGKEIGDKFRALAQRYDLQLAYGNAFPRARPDGVWFAGTVLPKGGWSVEEKAKDERLPFEIRERAFWKSLAKELEKFIEDGNTVKIESEQNIKAPSVE